MDWYGGWDYRAEVPALNPLQVQEPDWLQERAFPGGEGVPVFTHPTQVLFQWVHLFQNHILLSQHSQLPNILQALKKPI